MQALILAGGKGTRLRPLTVYTPKPIVPLMNRPFLLYQLEILARAGLKDVVLSLGYQPNKIEDILGNGSDLGVNLRFVTEPNPMGTGGAYKYAADAIRETTVVLNGDILTDADISKIVAFHQMKKSDATIALAEVSDPASYGLVETAADDSIVRFIEKPSPGLIAGLNINTINAGIYVLEPTILDLIANNENSSFEYNVFPAILEKRKAFHAFVLKESYWRDIGNPASYLEAHHDFLKGSIKGFKIDRESNADVATTAVIDKKSVIGEGCAIKPNARITNSVLGPGVQVEEKAVIENSVIWSHTRVSAFAEISDAFVGRSCHIGKNVSVGKGSVLGDKTSLPDYTKV
ncbi:MAG: NDP-sugar synthase [Saprospiraceae bacterium]|nr:NDP-sugar synthase [Pyrinomonadaceae bacterium]